MAFTNYKTWSAGETLTAANFNQQIRDNGLTMPPHLLARKTADESVASSTVVQDDDVLFAPVAASEAWLLRWVLRVSGISAADFKFGFTFPTAGEMTVNFSVSQGGVALVVGTGSSTSPLGSWSPDIDASGLLGQVIDATYVGGANAGNVKLQWAQATSNGTATIVKAQSTLWAVKLV